MQVQNVTPACEKNESSAYLMLRNECNSGEDSEGEYGARTTQSIVLIEKQKRVVKHSFSESVRSVEWSRVITIRET